MRHVLAVAQHGSIARAAEALNIAQPSLSRSLARVERELNTPLFNRTTQGSELTDLGRLVAERASRVLAATQSLLRDAQLARGGDAPELRIGIGPSLHGAFSKSLLGRLVEAHPTLRLHVDYAVRTSLVEKLLARELDVVLCASDDDVMKADVVLTEVFRSQALLVAAPHHPLATISDIQPGALAQYAVAGPPMPNFAISKVLGLANDEVVATYTATDWEPLVMLATAGKAVLLAPYLTVQPHLLSGALVRLDRRIDFNVSFVVACTRPASYSPLVAKVVQYAQAAAAEAAGPR